MIVFVGHLFSGDVGYPEAGNTSNHHPDKEGGIAAHDAAKPSVEKALQFAREHARNHHPQCHECGAEGVMSRFMFSLTKM